MEEKLELNLSFTKFTGPNNYHLQLPTSTTSTTTTLTTSHFSSPVLSPSSVFYPYINNPIMPSTPSSSSFSPSSLTHSTPAASPPPPSSPSAGGIQDAAFNGIVHANAHVNVNTMSVHHDLPLPAPPAAPTSPACAACKYQRRRCGPECMLSPYFPPERQQDFQNAHRLFGVSNIAKKLKDIAPSQRQTAVETMVYEAYMHAVNPPGGCHSQVKYLETQLDFLLRQLQEVRKLLASYKGQPVSFETDPQEQQYADQSRSSFVSLDNVNPCQQNQGSEEQQLQDYFYFNGNLINDRNNSSNADIGSHDIAFNYLNNDYSHNDRVEQQEAADQDELRPFMDILPNCSDSQEGEEQQLVYKSSTTVDMGQMAASLNSSLVDKSTKCSLGLGFSAF